MKEQAIETIQETAMISEKSKRPQKYILTRRNFYYTHLTHNRQMENHTCSDCNAIDAIDTIFVFHLDVWVRPNTESQAERVDYKK